MLDLSCTLVGLTSLDRREAAVNHCYQFLVLVNNPERFWNCEYWGQLKDLRRQVGQSQSPPSKSCHKAYMWFPPRIWAWNQTIWMITYSICNWNPITFLNNLPLPVKGKGWRLDGNWASGWTSSWMRRFGTSSFKEIVIIAYIQLPVCSLTALIS